MNNPVVSIKCTAYEGSGDCVRLYRPESWFRPDVVGAVTGGEWGGEGPLVHLTQESAISLAFALLKIVREADIKRKRQ